ncbi:hypothetical protein NLU14_08615 [Marinobacter sp. 71-i]|uniref:Uncharacterized protein n=1 Tax=Marinobacter iranensis TaxID=2962607 RepID=A0ABT5Y9D2_9GAMM|nr:hypothetical protein [Marinobacter iranensis]MDF0750291.1 hypothetical protein [Marinobacter iranensis]
MRLKVNLEDNLTPEPGWDSAICTSAGTNTNVATLTDWDTSTATDVVVDTITPFTDTFPYASGNYATGLTGGWEEVVWAQFNYSADLAANPAAVIDLRSTSATPTLVVGQSYLVRLGGAWGEDDRDVKYTVNGVSAVYNNITQAKPWVPPAPVEITAVATDDGTGKGVLRITAEEPVAGGRNYLAAIEVLEVAGLPGIRKGGSQTFDKPAGIGTIASVTLNGNAITLDSQDASTFTVTDSDASITASGAYDLVATGDTVETISVQVNVVGLSGNTLRKDGGILASLTDIEVIVMTGAAGSRVINQNPSGLVSDVSGDTAALEVPDLALSVDDPVFVILHSASQGAGVPFSTTLELI